MTVRGPLLPEKIGYTADLHNQDALLEELIDDAFRGHKFYDNVPCSRLVIVGDAIDRFDNPEAGIRVLQTIYDNRDRIIYLPGNHDRDVAMQRFNPELWEKHKAQWGFEDGNLAEMLKEDRYEHLADMLKNLDLFYEDDYSFAIHAGLTEDSIQATKDELDEILERSGEYGYITAPIPPIASHREQIAGAKDLDKIIVTGHKHYFDHEITVPATDARRIRLGCKAGTLCLATIQGNAQDLITTNTLTADHPVLPH